MKKIEGIIDRAKRIEFTIIDVIFVIIISSLTVIILYNFIYKKKIETKETNNIDSVYNQIVKYYYEDVDKDELANSAINGMMEYLDEKYSTYMDEGRTNSLNKELDGKYKGIGIIVEKNDKGVFVINVMKNSPAEKQGMQVGDQLLQVGSIKVNDDTKLSEVVDYIKENKEVAFTIRRESGDVVINVSVEDIPNPVVSSNTLTDGEDNYGYIYLESFSETSDVQFKSQLEVIEKNNLKGLIVDLRGNRGGYMEKAKSIAELFLKKDKVIYSIKEKDKEDYYYDGTDESRDYPIVVLVNKQTASSSELLALALKESYGAILVGTNTFGKSRVQFTSSLKNNTMVKYTTGIWYSPNHNNIDGVGIKPSYTVEIKDDKDAQLTKGLDVLIIMNK